MKLLTILLTIFLTFLIAGSTQSALRQSIDPNEIVITDPVIDTALKAEEKYINQIEVDIIDFIKKLDWNVSTSEQIMKHLKIAGKRLINKWNIPYERYYIGLKYDTVDKVFYFSVDIISEIQPKSRYMFEFVINQADYKK